MTILGHRKLIAFALVLVGATVLAALGRLTAEWAALAGGAFAAYAGANAYNAGARAKVQAVEASHTPPPTTSITDPPA